MNTCTCAYDELTYNDPPGTISPLCPVHSPNVTSGPGPRKITKEEK